MRGRLQYGFSLIELIVTIVIMGIISTVVGKIMVEGYQTFITAQNIGDADWQALLALESLTNDIHNIRSAADITTISASSFIFVDMDGTSITYQFSGSTLTRNAITVATGMSGFSLSYLNEAGAVTATPSAVRYVGINLTMLQNGLSLPFSTLVGTRGMA
jgi:prepilin-type N-terminal cleavage/methylation domain-containing protein